MTSTGHRAAPKLIDAVTIRHDAHELTWTAIGRVRVVIAGHEWIVDETKALWIPSALPHTVIPDPGALVLPVFLPPEQVPQPWSDPHHVLRTDELDALARTIAQPGLATASAVASARARVCEIIATGSVDDLRLPTDPRARTVAQELLADPSRQETLEEWGLQVHASAKTLQRCFAGETGMRFPDWRTHVRLRAARRLLSTDQDVRGIAAEVGYASTAAFISAFRRRYGETPARLRADTLSRRR
ncbi:helix-turn-helix transcriptional regulator [Microbacterium ulmi]|uniref:HTH-type transcriptional regulator RipA n=1 Tax=Microbacterium ulmi TaxID=179095 RepID=A0A7Y2LXB4_9MICO|nr:AraC family transcriptional regulator [Microbacterium ulmi]NII71236.1 AraC-like DNA-binding protein [Microbacterium ulmi]NNH02541.1 helix-turn-helix transcriptional regulator [Microbacterium ulmi]